MQQRTPRGAPASLGTPELKEADFQSISALVKRHCGINLHAGKEELVKARLGKRLRALGLDSYGAYLDYLRRDHKGEEMLSMLDTISTNVTSFFREPGHFQFVARCLIPAYERAGRLRAWSAGCSTGEEPYSIAMLLREQSPALCAADAKILATDLSTRALAAARQGVYDGEKTADVPALLRSKYFQAVAEPGGRVRFAVAPAARALVRFARLNLMEDWPMRGPFDLIFCRNVMIYFDKPTRQVLIRRFWELLARGGMLFIGHAESFTGIRHDFKYVEPTVYQKP